MKFILSKDKLTIEDKESLNSGSLKYYEIEVEKDETWDDLSIGAIIIKEGADKGIAIPVINNKVYVDRQTNGKYFVGFKGYTVEYNLTEDAAIDTGKTYYIRSGEEESYIYTKVDNPAVENIATYYEEAKTYQQSTNLVAISFLKGAGEIEVRNEEVPTQSEWEAYVAQIEDMVDGLESEIPTKLSDLTNDNNTVTDANYVHTDNNYTTVEKTKLAGLNNYDDTEVRGLIAGKVDKETGKGLSTNDYTTAEKTKLANLENYNDAEIKQDIVDLGINKADKSEIPDVSGFYTKPNTGIPKTDLSSSVQTSLGKADTAVQDISGKQDTLISGTNIKTINNTSILGSGNIEIQGGGGTSDYTDLENKPSINNVTLSGNKSLNDLGIVIPDISGKLDTTKVKNETSTIAGDVYDVRYINSMIGNIETLLGGI